MKRNLAVLFIACLACMGMALAQEPSAKFAAVWSDDLLAAYSSTGDVCDDSGLNVDMNSGMVLATMKMPNGKEILAGISAESLILLNTGVKGKNGGSGTAVGWGRVVVDIAACNQDTDVCYEPVPSDRIVLHARLQALSATLGGVIESCTVGDDGVIDVDTECTVTDEEIALLTAHRSANHFNVVFADLPQGTYEVKANFRLLSVSFAESTVDACAYASSLVVLGNRIVTLQDVRAAKGGIVEF